MVNDEEVKVEKLKPVIYLEVDSQPFVKTKLPYKLKIRYQSFNDSLQIYMKPMGMNQREGTKHNGKWFARKEYISIPMGNANTSLANIEVFHETWMRFYKIFKQGNMKVKSQGSYANVIEKRQMKQKSNIDIIMED